MFIVEPWVFIPPATNVAHVKVPPSTKPPALVLALFTEPVVVSAPDVVRLDADEILILQGTVTPAEVIVWEALL